MSSRRIIPANFRATRLLAVVPHLTAGWGDCYLRGLMLDGRHKSIQPMAERLPDGNMRALQQFVNQSPWDPLSVRLRIAQKLCEVVPPEAWVVDDCFHPGH